MSNEQSPMPEPEQFSEEEIKEALEQAVKDGSLRRIVKDGKEYWVNNDQRHN